MLRYKIEDIRYFWGNDIRFLEQFNSIYPEAAKDAKKKQKGFVCLASLAVQRRKVNYEVTNFLAKRFH